MTRPIDSTPILARPHTLRGQGRVRLTGTGEVVFRLEGRGSVTVRRGPADSVHFSGDGRLRHVAADRVILSQARGHLVVDGTDLELEFSGGPISIAVHGHFAVETKGCGQVETSRGKCVRFGHSRSRFRLEGARLVHPAA